MAIYIVYIGALLYIIILLCHSGEEIKCNPLGGGMEGEEGDGGFKKKRILSKLGMCVGRS